MAGASCELSYIWSVLWLMLMNEMRACNHLSSLYCSWSPNGAFDELSSPLINVRFTSAGQNWGKLQLWALKQWHLRLMSLTREIVHPRMKILILFNHPLMSLQTCISNVLFFYGIKNLRIFIYIDIFPIIAVELKKDKALSKHKS